MEPTPRAFTEPTIKAGMYGNFGIQIKQEGSPDSAVARLRQTTPFWHPHSVPQVEKRPRLTILASASPAWLKFQSQTR
ncbi:MAG: hypothetical protein RLY69_1320 [Verrucomicrobiota bacterium]